MSWAASSFGKSSKASNASGILKTHSSDDVETKDNEVAKNWDKQDITCAE